MRGRQLDRFEQEDAEFHARVARRLPRRWPPTTRSAGSSSTARAGIDDVADAIRAAVRERLGSDDVRRARAIRVGRRGRSARAPSSGCHRAAGNRCTPTSSSARPARPRTKRRGRSPRCCSPAATTRPAATPGWRSPASTPTCARCAASGARISAEQIDEIIRTASLAPVEGDRKVMILDEFHLLDRRRRGTSAEDARGAAGEHAVHRPRRPGDRPISSPSPRAACASSSRRSPSATIRDAAGRRGLDPRREPAARRGRRRQPRPRPRARQRSRARARGATRSRRSRAPRRHRHDRRDAVRRDRSTLARRSRRRSLTDRHAAEVADARRARRRDRRARQRPQDARGAPQARGAPLPHRRAAQRTGRDRRRVPRRARRRHVRRGPDAAVARGARASTTRSRRSSATRTRPCCCSRCCSICRPSQPAA